MNRSIRSGIAIAAVLGAVALLPALAGDSQGDRVLVTKPGVVFHKAGSEDIRGRALEKTMDGALEAGYAPCPVCFAKEIQTARGLTSSLGGSTMASRFSANDVPAPPVTTVVQPFGLRYAVDHTHGPKDAIRNPYEDVTAVIPGRAEQGAYGQH